MVYEIIYEFVIVGKVEGVEFDEEEIIKYVMDIFVKVVYYYFLMY